MIRSEWTKLRTVRSGVWLLVALVSCTVVVSTLVVLTMDARYCPAPGACDADTVRGSLTGVYLGQVAAVVLGVLAVTGEYGTGTIQTTLAATPRRLLALTSKALVVVGVATAVGALGVLGSIAAGRLILPGHGYAPMRLTDPATLRATGGTVLYIGLIALLSLGIGYTLRDTAVSISAVLAMLYVIPIVASMVNNDVWRRWMLRLAPMTAGLAIQTTKGVDRLPLTPWQGMGVMSAYAVAAMVVGVLLFTRRDA